MENLYQHRTIKRFLSQEKIGSRNCLKIYDFDLMKGKVNPVYCVVFMDPQTFSFLPKH